MCARPFSLGIFPARGSTCGPVLNRLLWVNQCRRNLAESLRELEAQARLLLLLFPTPES